MRHFLRVWDVNAEELAAILAAAQELKKKRAEMRAQGPFPLAGRQLALVFDKASTRTRVSFEVAMHELGGHALYLHSSTTQLGRGEPVEDTARVLSRMVDVIAVRTHAHATVERFAAFASVPVINALTDWQHPCQILADLLTVQEALGELAGLKVAWVGDGNNMAHAWIEAAALARFSLVLACPEGFDPDAALVEEARARGAEIALVRSPEDAVRGADVVTTDVWASMGQESEAEARQKAFSGYTVDQALMSQAAPHAIFLHCLPAHRGEEVSAEVLEGEQSRVWDEAENRLHTQKALLLFLFGRL
ncbi:MAG: ornithine carbamoyltransferase [Zetaproteobacteria bacterium]|nr:MAG: ornithine carbamoyltransferase [Zetaproteobacteria bacterium]